METEQNQELNREAVMMAEIRKKETVSAVVLGVFLYMGISFAVVFVMSAAWELCLACLPPAAADLEGFMNGVMMILSVLVPIGPVWLYFHSPRRRMLLFQDRSAFALIFQRKRKMRPGLFAGLCILIFLLQFLYGTAFAVMEYLFNSIGLTLMESGSMAVDFHSSYTMLLYACLIGPFVEELVYRGFVMYGLETFGKLFAVTVSALLFGFMHCDLPQLLFTLLVGLVLGYTAIEYGFLWGLALHVFNNLVLGQLWVSFLNLFDEDMQNLIYLAVFAAVLAAGVIFLFISLRPIADWFRRNQPDRGTFRYAVSFWLIAFILLSILIMVLQIRPYTPPQQQTFLAACLRWL